MCAVFRIRYLPLSVSPAISFVSDLVLGSCNLGVRDLVIFYGNTPI